MPTRFRARRIAVAMAVLTVQMPLGFARADGERNVAPSPQERIGQLVEQLGDDDYFAREQAEEELAGYSFEAFDALMAATEHQDLEVAARARHLLRLLSVAWTTKDDPEEVRHILSDYEAQSGTDKLLRMQRLAELEEGQGVAALCRLVRFEQSLVLSKLAALALIESYPSAEPPPENVCRQIEGRLTDSRRCGAMWLMAWTGFREDPASAVGRFGNFLAEEEALLARQPSQNGAEIVAGLARFEIPWLRKLDRQQDALAGARVLIRLEKGDPRRLLDLLDWLIEQRAWVLVDETSTHFADVFALQPLLQYTLADAQLAQGKEVEAERIASQALGLHPGNAPDDLRRHALMARMLEERGQMRWAIEESRQVIRNGTPGTALVAEVQLHLSELLHDQGEDLEAAETLEALLAALQKPPPPGDPPQPPGGGNPFGQGDHRLDLDDEARETIRGRMFYFFACEYESRHDRAKQREFLEKSLDTGHADIDVLIACHRLPDTTPEFRARVAKLIAEETARLRRNIAEEPLLPTWYNQFAWLVGNTGGDLDAALKFSRRSIELQPEYGGYHDTLAHVLFAQGEYEKAVEAQLKAAELEPHSGLIARQLRVFQVKLEETKREGRE